MGSCIFRCSIQRSFPDKPSCKALPVLLLLPAVVLCAAMLLLPSCEALLVLLWLGVAACEGCKGRTPWELWFPKTSKAEHKNGKTQMIRTSCLPTGRLKHLCGHRSLQNYSPQISEIKNGFVQLSPRWKCSLCLWTWRLEALATDSLPPELLLQAMGPLTNSVYEPGHASPCYI